MIVRKLRLQRGWTQEHLAGLSGLSVRSIQRLERGQTGVFMYLIFVAAFGFFMGFKHPLILWGSIGWGIGLVVHGLNVFEVINLFGPNWEKKQIEKRLGLPL
jgi:transcriptional regulator with XRE-family HTH domain